MTGILTRTRGGRLDADNARRLGDEGYLLLRGAIPADETFDGQEAGASKAG